jgi:hypothetical protein
VTGAEKADNDKTARAMERIKFIKGLSPDDFMAKRNDYITELISLKNYLKYGWINKAALVALARPRKNSKKPGSVVVGKPLPQGLKLGGAQKFVVHVGPGRWGKGKGRNTMVYYDGTNRVVKKNACQCPVLLKCFLSFNVNLFYCAFA